MKRETIIENDPLYGQYVEIKLDTGDTYYGLIDALFECENIYSSIVISTQEGNSVKLSMENVETIKIVENAFCTSCGAELCQQEGFADNDGYWQCKKCGTVLSSPSISDNNLLNPDIVWICDNCGTILNSQVGFTDFDQEWTCTQCGFKNSITEDDICDSNVKGFS